MHSVVVFTLFMIFAGPVSAKIYKWVDEDGKVHFSDRQDHSVEHLPVLVWSEGNLVHFSGHSVVRE